MIFLTTYAQEGDCHVGRIFPPHNDIYGVETVKAIRVLQVSTGLPRQHRGVLPRNDIYRVYYTKDATFTFFALFTIIASLRGGSVYDRRGNPIET